MKADGSGRRDGRWERLGVMDDWDLGVVAPDAVDIQYPRAGEGLQVMIISWPFLASSCLLSFSPAY